jgi:hypothetical protein
MARGRHCTVHRHQYVTSEERHHLQPQSRGGPTNAGNLVWLCANAHGDVHYFLDLIEDAATALMRTSTSTDGVTPADAVRHVPSRLAKHYSPAVRHTAAAGWHRYSLDFLAGKYAAHHLLWSSSGEPRYADPSVPPYAVAARLSAADHWLGVARSALESRP